MHIIFTICVCIPDVALDPTPAIWFPSFVSLPLLSCTSQLSIPHVPVCRRYADTGFVKADSESCSPWQLLEESSVQLQLLYSLVWWRLRQEPASSGLADTLWGRFCEDSGRPPFSVILWYQGRIWLSDADMVTQTLHSMSDEHWASGTLSSLVTRPENLALNYGYSSLVHTAEKGAECCGSLKVFTHALCS